MDSLIVTARSPEGRHVCAVASGRPTPTRPILTPIGRQEADVLAVVYVVMEWDGRFGIAGWKTLGEPHVRLEPALGQSELEAVERVLAEAVEQELGGRVLPSSWSTPSGLGVLESASRLANHMRRKSA